MGLFDRLVVGLLPVMPRRLVWRFARRYIAGTTIQSALDTVRQLNEEGASSTLALLGEHVTTPEAAQAAQAAYLDLIRDIAAARRADGPLRTGLSIKPSLLGLAVGEDFCAEQMAPVFSAAQEHALLVRIDMEDHAALAPTLRLHRTMRKRYDNAGIVLQAYLHRTLSDIDGLPPDSNVRLCKGIYVEPRARAWQAYETVRENFIYALEKLFRLGHRVAIATHDEHLVWAGNALIDRFQVPPERVEFQMLLGVDPPLRRILLDQGHRLRVYVPYGEDWYPYSVRRLRENPQVARHVLRALFRR
jgi:proline dehydrogenase